MTCENCMNSTARKKIHDKPRQLIKKQRCYFANKCPYVKAMVSPIIMYRCESWTIKKAKHQRVDAFGLWCSRRLLRVPCTARRSNQWILKEINHEYSLEGLMLIAEAPILWPPDAKNWLILKDPDAGKDWRQKEKGTTEDEMVGWHYEIINGIIVPSVQGHRHEHILVYLRK